MEVVETPTFWCPHVERVACTNFSPRIVELRPPESREIFHFPFLLSPFSFISLYELFYFIFLCFLFLLSFFPFLFAYLFFFSFHLISLSFSPHFLFAFLSHFDGHCRMSQEKEISFSFPQTKLVALNFSIFIPYLIIPSL